MLTKSQVTNLSLTAMITNFKYRHGVNSKERAMIGVCNFDPIFFTFSYKETLYSVIRGKGF